MSKPRMLIPALIGLLFLAAPFALCERGDEYAELPKALLLQTGAWALLLLQLTLHGRQMRLGMTHLAALSLVLWAALSGFWATAHYEWSETLALWTAAFVLFAAVSSAAADRRGASLVLECVFAGATGVAVLGVGQWALEWDFVPQTCPPAATFANRNLAAEFVAMTLPLGALLLHARWGKWWRMAYAWGMAVQAGFLLATASKAAALAMAVQLAALLLWLLHRRGFKRLSAPALLLSAIALAGLCLLGARAGLHQRFLDAWGNATDFAAMIRKGGDLDQSVRGQSSYFRISTWANTAPMFLDHWLAGVGCGNFSVHFPKYRRSVLPEGDDLKDKSIRHCHNDYLELAVELGVVGLALAGWLLVALVLLVRGSRSCLDFGLSTCLLSMGVLMVFGFPLHCACPPMLAALYAGMLSRQGRRFRIPLVALVAIALAALTVGAWNWRRFEADKRHMAMRMERLNGFHDAALLECVAVTELNPLRTAAYLDRGELCCALGRTDEAELWLKASLRRYPFSARGMEWLGRLGSNRGDHAAAAELLRDSLALNPFSAATLNRYGTLMLQLGNHEEAGRFLAAACVEAPGDASLHYDFALYLAGAGCLREALTESLLAARLSPGDLRSMRLATRIATDLASEREK